MIIKYFLFISSISCNNKGLFKLNDSIIKLELNVTKIKNVTINGYIKTFYSSGTLYFDELNINHVEIIMSDYVESYSYMFNGCNSITKIDLSNFDTSQVTNMYGMFNGCSSLTSLNLSNFDTSQVTDMYGMFYNCKNLEYINLQNFKDNSLTSFSNIFENVTINVVVCIDETIASKISEKLVQKCKTISCSENWKSEQNKIDPEENCINNCITNTQYINDNSINKICK